jgi:peroxiredoxin
MLQKGDFLPWYVVQTSGGAKFELEKLGGRYVVLCFFGSSSNSFSRRVLDDIEHQCQRFDGEEVAFVGFSVDPKDTNLQPGWDRGVYLCDATGNLSRLHEVMAQDGSQFQPQTIILDPQLRVASVLPFAGDPESHVPRLLDVLNALPPLQAVVGHAPIVILPHVFEPEFCRALIQLYEQHGGNPTGGMKEVDGQSVRILDHRLKTRSDHAIVDDNIKEAALLRMGRRLLPEVQKAFQFRATNVERHLVACYDAAMGGHFKAHRDNMTPVTAHRKFAVTINLNAEDYEGGDLCFPEYGSRLYRCPTGGAVVFSCSLRHEAKSVTKGRRFAYLPFLYDEASYKQYLAAHARTFPLTRTDGIGKPT